MLMADTMAVFFVVVGLMVSFVGLWLLARGMWPKRVVAAAERFERGVMVPFLAGLPLSLVAFIATVLVSKLPGPFGGILAGAIVCAYIAFANVGISGLATCIGRRLASGADAANPWRPTLRGSVVLVLCFLMPILGWFAVLPIALIAGAGSATIALLEPVLRRAIVPASSPASQVTQTADLTQA